MSRVIRVMLEILYFCINFLSKLILHRSDSRKNERKMNYSGSLLFLNGDPLESLESVWERESKSSIFQLKKDWEYRYPCLAGQELSKLQNLRCLSVVFADLDGDFDGLHSQLRWLEWRGCSGNLTPTNFYLGNLVILDLLNSRMTNN